MTKKKLNILLPVILVMLVLATSIFSIIVSATTISMLDGDLAITDTQNTVKNSNGTVTATAKGSLFSKKTNTITITNNSGAKAKLSFTYSVDKSSSFTIDDSSANASGNYEKTLEAGGTVKIAITSNKGFSDLTVTLTMSNIVLSPVTDSNITFEFDETLGSVTVGGTVIATGTSKTVSADGIALVATPKSGATFLGWKNKGDNTLISSAATYTLTPTGNVTVQAVFASATSDAWFLVDNKYLFNDLNAAAAAGTTVVLYSNGTLPTGDYTIPSGVTLLIPFDTANTMYTTSPALVTDNANVVTPTAYRTLTMADGAHIIVNGAISLSGKVHAYMGSRYQNSAPTGPSGFINMNKGSSITINNGANLYAWGYIVGNGNITVENGGTVYECFQLRDWRGGDASSSMNNNDKKVFLVSQYYIQNIEAPLTLKTGATEKVFLATYVSSMQKTATVAFFGSTGLIRIGDNSSVTKRYDGATDRLIIDVIGAATFSSFSFSIDTGFLGSITVNSAKYVMPINSNITINVKSGSEVNVVGQDIALLPGAVLNIEEGATVTMGSATNLYVYDQDQWGAYCVGSVKFRAVCWAYSRTKTRTDADLVDAKICVNNGTLDASQGFLYTTAGGANICSTGDGEIIVGTVGSNTVTYQATQSGTDISYVEIPITPAKLKNADGTYTVSTKGTYKYINGVWQCQHVNPNFDAAADNRWVIDPATGEVSCVTTAQCDCGAALTATAAISDVVKTEATCMEKGTTTYTATFTETWIPEHERILTKDIQDIEIDPENHISTDGTTCACGAKLCSHNWTDATCTAPKTCSLCGTTEGTALGHSWNAATYNFAADGKTCTATHVCSRDGSHTETVTATITQTVKVAATCMEKGTTTYTAKFSVSWATQQTKDVQDIATNSSAHSWGSDVTYSGDGKNSYTATRKCLHNSNHTETATAQITNVITTQPSCTAAGEKTYTATFTETWATGKTTTEPVAQTAHQYSETWSTDADNHWHKCTLCDAKDAVAEHSDTTIKDHKCDTCGYIMSSCSDADNDSDHDCDHCGKEGVTQHAYGNVTYTGDGKTSYKASRTCNCGDTQTATAQITNAITTQPSCTAAGEKTYTATFTETWATGKTTTEPVEQTAHQYSETWTTDADNHWHKCTLCDAKDAVVAHSDTTTKDHKCDTCGYIMSSCSDADNDSDHDCDHCGKEGVTQHAYGNVTYTGDGKTSYKASRTCNCGDTQTATAQITNAITTQPSCTAAGEKTYTATFTETWATGKTTTEPVAQTAHQYSETWSTDADNHWHKCTLCDAKDAVVAHSDTTTKDHKCDTCGYIMSSCSGGTATCEKKAECTVCGKEYGDLAKHTFSGDWQPGKAPTCTEAGSEYRQCTVCGVERQTQTVEALGHSFEEVGEVPSDCKENTPGVKAHWMCSVCGKHFKEESAKSLIEDFDEWKLNEGIIPAAHTGGKATCEERATCSECGEKYGELGSHEDDGSGHCIVCGTVTCKHEGTLVEKDYKAPTCTEEGNSAHWYCSACEERYLTNDEEGLKVPLAEKDWKLDMIQHSDSAEDGDHECDECGAENVTVCGDEAEGVKDHVCNTDSACAVYSTGNNACADGNDNDHKCDYGCGKDDLTPHVYTLTTTNGYVWGTDGKSCTANGVCVCGHTTTATATIAGAVKTPATCTEKGTTTYTAKFSVSWATQQTKDVQDIATNSSAHSWGSEVTYSGDGKNSYTATRKCLHNSNHTETATAQITNAITTQPSCTAAGEKTYTATFTEIWANDKTTTEPVAQTNHQYSETWSTDADNHWHKCTLCDAKDAVAAHSDTTTKDHKCDTCGRENITAHVDENHDHACDNGCSTKIGACTDAANDGDHVCDYGKGYENGCKAELSKCADSNKDGDHKCDECDADNITVCGDEAEGVKDHVCNTDEACTVYSTGDKEHKDGDDNNHTCDYCNSEELLSDCVDIDPVDNKCDVCGKEDFCAHEYTDTVTPPSCGKEGYTTHTCSKCTYSYKDTYTPALEHSYTNYTYNNDATCTANGTKTASCDHGCGEKNTIPAENTMLEHKDEDPKDHKCDECGKETGTSCVDENKDHVCDFTGCLNTAIGECVDNDHDHKCDYGEDSETGCKLWHGGAHSDSATDKDHVCDYCGGEIENGESCSDKTDDGDHNCDVCGKADVTEHTYADATCTTPKTCTECGATEGEVIPSAHKYIENVWLSNQEGHWHKCENCDHTTPVVAHSDNSPADHECDVCEFVMSECADGDGDTKCDICGEKLVFTITFVDYFGDKTTKEVKYGNVIEFPECSSMETTCFTLTFKCWKLQGEDGLTDIENGVTATADATYVAVYDVETAKYPPMMSVEYGAKETNIVMYVNLFVYADKGGQIQPIVVIENPDAEDEDGRVRTIAAVHTMDSSKQTVYVYKIGLTAEDISDTNSVIKVLLGNYTQEIKNVVLGYANALGDAGILQDQSNSDIPKAVIDAQKTLINDIIAYGNNVQIYFNKDTSSFPKDHVETFPTVATDKMTAYKALNDATDPEYSVASDVVDTDFIGGVVSFEAELGLYFVYNVRLKAENATIVKKGIIISDSALSDTVKQDYFTNSADAIFAEAKTNETGAEAEFMSGIDGETINDIEDKYATIYVEYKVGEQTYFVYGSSMVYGIGRYVQKQIYRYSPTEQGGLGNTVSGQEDNENATKRYVHLLTSILQANDSAAALEAAKDASQSPETEEPVA